MKKKFLMSALATIVIVATSGMSYAQDIYPQNKIEKKAEKPYKHLNKPHMPYYKGHHPSKAEMEAKKAEFEKRLNLTEEQKKQIEENKIKDREKMKPIFDEMKSKRMEIMNIKKDNKLSDSEKVKKSAELEKDIIDLRVKADELRRENMKNFENILTKEQLEEFSKIKEEQKQHMEKMRKQFEGKKKLKGSKPPIGLPVQPKPIPLEK